MNTKLPTLLALSVLALGTSACTQEDRVMQSAPGTYEKTVTSTDGNGTTVQRKSSTEVEVDEYGNKKATIKSKTTNDPKGLFNKTTTSKTEQEIEERPVPTNY